MRALGSMVKPSRSIAHPYSPSRHILAASEARLDLLLRRFGRQLQDHTLLWLVAFTAMYAFGVVQISRFKPLWFDELFSYYVSLLPNLKSILAAGQADTHPPLQFLFIKASFALFGKSDLTTRLPVMVAFWVLCLCLFQFVRARYSTLCAFVALLLPLSTGAFYYAYEARPYGLVLAFSGLALVFWQMAADGRRRRLALPLLAASIAGALGSHYYAILQLGFPIALAELARTLQRRRVDIGVWLALAVGASPLIFLLPMGLRASKDLSTFVLHSPDFWSKPLAMNVVYFFEGLAKGLAFPLILALAFSTLALFAGGEPASRPERRGSGLQFHEKVAVLGFLFVPVLMYLFTKFKTGYFMDRYCETAVLGLTILICASLDYFLPRRSAVALVFLLAATFFIPHLSSLRKNPRGSATSMPPLSSIDTDPFVIANPLTFLQVAHYAPPAIRSRLYYLADPALAVKLPDFLPELALVAGRNILPFQIIDHRRFLEEHPTFWMTAGTLPDLEWLPRQLLKEGYSLSLTRTGWTVYRVTSGAPGP